MKTLLVIISDKCNLDCDFCYVHPKLSTILNVDAFLKWFELYQKLMPNEEIELLFHGGEPLLCAEEMLKIINGTKDYNVKYEVNTNLCYELTPSRTKVLEYCNVVTSWDPFPLRFKDTEDYNLWKYNCTIVKPKSIGVVLSKTILEFDPRSIFDNCVYWGFDNLFLQKMFVVGKAKKDLIPQWRMVDDWLCKAYDVRISSLKVNIFEDIEYMISQGEEFRYRFGDRDCDITVCPDGSIQSLGPDGAVVLYSELTSKTTNNIFEPLTTIKSCACENKEQLDQGCRICEVLQYCNGDCFNINKWYDDVCSFPKKLFKKIKNESNSRAISSL